MPKKYIFHPSLSFPEFVWTVQKYLGLYRLKPGLYFGKMLIQAGNAFLDVRERKKYQDFFMTFCISEGKNEKWRKVGREKFLPEFPNSGPKTMFDWLRTSTPKHRVYVAGFWAIQIRFLIYSAVTGQLWRKSSK